MAGILTATDTEISNILSATLTRLNESSFLGLYTGSPDISPTTTLDDLTPATYAAYAEIDLTAAWGVVTQESTGLWYIRTPVQVFSVNPDEDGPTEEDITGVFITDGENLLYAGPLPETYSLESGGISLQIRPYIKVSDRLSFEFISSF